MDITDLMCGNFIDQIKVALSASKYLIVICSPNSKNSVWVRKEIEAFKEFGNKGNIIPIVVPIDSKSNISIEECLPEELVNYNALIVEGGNIKTSCKRIVDLIVCRILDIKPEIGRYCERSHGVESLINNVKRLWNAMWDRLDNTESERLDEYEPKKNGTDIFISYRRVGGQDVARGIDLALTGLGYKNVFFDFNSIQEGRFNTQILDAIYSCNDFILVLTNKSMNRCSRKNDWVAREIRTALKYERHIIPVVVNGSFEEWPWSFPRDLASIKSLQRFDFRTDFFFGASIKGLVERLKTTCSGKQETPSRHDGASGTDIANFKVRINRSCDVHVDGQKSFQVEANKIFVHPMKKGEYFIEIVTPDDNMTKKEFMLVLDSDKARDIVIDS